MINNLRISVTDKCNLKCIYCAPKAWRQGTLLHEKLTLDEMERSVKIFARLGISHVKLTGGEPLLEERLTEIIARIRQIPGIADISLTTNGALLAQQVQALKNAGLDRLNISMDALHRERFFRITQKDFFENVYQGFLAALKCDFKLIKINVIPLKGMNESELMAFIELSKAHNVIVRFIELFSTNESSDGCAHLRITSAEVKRMIVQHFGPLQRLHKDEVRGNGPAVYFQIKNTPVKVGFISNFSENFCDECTRMRMDSQGNILPCLFSSPVCNLKELFRKGVQDDDVYRNLYEVIDQKIMFNKRTNCQKRIEMIKVGG